MNTKFISSGILLIATMLVSSCSKSHSHNYEDAEETVDVAFPETDSVTLTNTYPGYFTPEAKVDVVGRVSGQCLAKISAMGNTSIKGLCSFA